MSEPSHGPSPEDLLLLTTVIGQVARRHRLLDVDRQDFAQTAQLKFVERNYDAFARFRGESSLRTYLTVVVTRLLLDWRNARDGKWRPSAAARRFGAQAIYLDRLLNRDGFPQDQAVEIVHRTTGAPSAALQLMADRLPRRCRPRLVGEELIPPMAALEGFRDPIEAREQHETERRRSWALGRACRQLTLEDQRLLALRYKRALSVREISQVLGMDQKALYRRFESVVSRLRTALADRAPTGLIASQ